MLQILFDGNLYSQTLNITARFTRVIGFIIAAPNLPPGVELEIDYYLQIYFPDINGELVRTLRLNNSIDTQSIIPIPFEFLEFEKSIVFLSSDTTYLKVMGIFAENLGGLTSSSTATKTTATVNTTAASLIAANANRKGLTIKNVGNRQINIDFVNTVSSTNYFIAIANGASYSFDTSYSGEIFAIAIGAASSAQLIEFT